MAGNITNDNHASNGVKLGRCQYRRSASPERGILMPSQDDIARTQIIEALDALSPTELEDFFSQVLRLELRKPLQDHPLLVLLSMSQE